MAEIEGTLIVGLKVKIEGIFGDSNFVLAREVEVAEVEEED